METEKLYANSALIVVAIFAFAQVSYTLSSYQIHELEVDALCNVYRVVDGDTLRCKLVEMSEKFLGIGPDLRVRLADVNAPELRPYIEPGALEALKRLEELVFEKTVALDIDDHGVTDRYGRVVAIVLAPWNDTHWVNVNLLLVIEGLASIWEHDNEWRLADTPLFVQLGMDDRVKDGGTNVLSSLGAQGLLELLLSGALVLFFVKLVLISRRRPRKFPRL